MLKHRWFVPYVALVFTAATMVSCDSDSPSGPRTANVAGTWDVSISGASGNLSAVATLSQSGNHVTGTWRVVNGSSGSIEGTMSGSTLVFTLSLTSGCRGSASGSAAVRRGDTLMQGSYSGSTICGSGSDSFFANKR